MRRGTILKVGFLAALFVLAAAASGYAAEIVETLSDVPEPVKVTLPYMSNRTAIWIISELHLLFAAFILGAPMFVVACEYIGMRTKDPRFERLAKEITKVTLLCYAFTVLFGGMFAMFLFGLYPELSGYLFSRFFPVTGAIYSILWVCESTLMYLYWYTWDSVGARHKRLHLCMGIGVNILGLLTLLAINSMASFMLTPPKPVIGATLWEIVNNPTWIPLVIHRIIGNACFGGFIAAMIAAYMFIMAKSDEDRAYYDWQGFVGTLIGMIFLIPLPIAGYIYSKELYTYGAEIGVYQMSDRLSMFFVLHGTLTGILFITANYYVYLSMKRIEGVERLRRIVKYSFLLMFICTAVWITPRHFIATMILEPGMGYATEAEMVRLAELPPSLSFLALMPAKLVAVSVIILVTLVNYILYFRALMTGKIIWGKIDAAASYTLIFLAFTVIWIMVFMGAVRELNRKFYHVYLHIKDYTPDSFSPTLAKTALMTTMIAAIFFGILSFIIWLMLHKKGDASKA